MDSLTLAIPLLRKLALAGDRVVALIDEIGRGTSATVHSAQITGPWGGPRAVAVKLIDRHPSGFPPRVLALLEDAVHRAASVHHPHVAQTYDFDLAARAPFLVTELVDGGSLEKLANAYTRGDRQMPQDLAILIAIKVASGLHGALSAAQLVHGNLTARDVLISWSGELKVTDFGLHVPSSGVSMVREVDSAARVAAIAPEVACGALPTARSDVFSLGILLHQLLLGQRFSPHTSPGEALELVRDGIVHKSLMEPQLVHPLRVILRRCLERDPAKRYEHAGEVAADLKKLAVLLGIPDVPAYVANAVDEAFGSRRCEAPIAEESSLEIRDDDIFEAEVIGPPTQSGLRLRRFDSAPTLITHAACFDD